MKRPLFGIRDSDEVWPTYGSGTRLPARKPQRKRRHSIALEGIEASQRAAKRQRKREFGGV